jgi:hypothetical protein
MAAELKVVEKEKTPVEKLADIYKLMEKVAHYPTNEAAWQTSAAVRDMCVIISFQQGMIENQMGMIAGLEKKLTMMNARMGKKKEEDNPPPKAA